MNTEQALNAMAGKVLDDHRVRMLQLAEKRLQELEKCDPACTVKYSRCFYQYEDAVKMVKQVFNA
jgi:hypothetical protein